MLRGDAASEPSLHGSSHSRRPYGWKEVSQTPSEGETGAEKPVSGRNRSRQYVNTWPVIRYPAGIESWPGEQMEGEEMFGLDDSAQDSVNEERAGEDQRSAVNG